MECTNEIYKTNDRNKYDQNDRIREHRCTERDGCQPAHNTARSQSNTNSRRGSDSKDDYEYHHIKQESNAETLSFELSIAFTNTENSKQYLTKSPCPQVISLEWGLVSGRRFYLLTL